MLENPWHVYMDVFFHTVLLSIVFCLKPKTPGLNMVKPFWGPTNFKWIKSNTEKWPSAVSSYFHHLNTLSRYVSSDDFMYQLWIKWGFIRMTIKTHFQLDQVLIKQGMLMTFLGSSYQVHHFFPKKWCQLHLWGVSLSDQDLPSPVKRKSSPLVNGHSRILNWRYIPYIRPIL